MQSNTIADADIELLEDTTLATANAAMVAEEVLLGSNKQGSAAWIEQVLRTIISENIKTESSSMEPWLKSTNNHNTIKYTRHEKNLITGNDRTVIKFFAEWDQQQQLHPTYNGPRTGNYLKRLKSNYQALLKTIEFYQQDYQLVNVAGLKFELNTLYQQQRETLQKICKIDRNMIARAASTDKNAINDFHTNHENSLELIQKFNESAILKIKRAHCQAISEQTILKKVKEMEITAVRSDEENPLHTDLIHIFPIIHNHKTIDGRKEQKVYWYLSTTIPLGTIYPTAYRALGEGGVTNFRLHLLCRINGDIKLDDFSNTSLTPLTQVIRHSAFPAIYEQDLDRKKDSHLEMMKRVNQRLAKLHELDALLEDGDVAELKIMTLMLMTPYFGETLNKDSVKPFTPLLKKIPNLEMRGIIDADHNIQLRGNESEVSQVDKSYQAISANPPLIINLKDANDNPISITVQRETSNPVFQLPVNLETTPVIKHATKFIDTSVLLHPMVRAINHEGYFKLEQLFLQHLQAKINNIDPNKKKQSQLDKLLVEYTERVGKYAAEFELIYQQQDHKDYKKLTKTRQKIYQKFDQAFAELRSGLIKLLGRIENLEDRKFASILIEFINVQKLFANLRYDKTYSGQLAYEMMSRLAVIANWLDYYVEIFCKSSKDRSGMLTLLIESFETFYDMLGHYPQLDNKNDAIWLQNILNSSIIFYSTSKVVASLNSPGSEGLNQSHVPFLQEHARDYLHSIGKLSKKTWAIKFDKSDPHADKRKPAPNLGFLQDTNQVINRFIADIKLENGFAKAIDQTNTELETLRKDVSYRQMSIIKAKLPQLKQRLIDAINEFHAKTEDDNQAFEETFKDLKNRLISARYYSPNQAIFAGSDSKRACQPEFITQLKQLLAQVNEFRANNQSHGQNSKTIQQLNYNLALMVNILTRYKNTIREKIEALNDRESETITGWDADLAAHQNKSAPLTAPSLEDNGFSEEDAYQSEQELADTEPLLSRSLEEQDSSQQVVTEQAITNQEFIEACIKEAITSFDMARRKHIIEMEGIDKLLKDVDHLRQILIADWELRKFKQETFLVKVAITRFIERLLTTDEMTNDKDKTWRDELDRWADDSLLLIDDNEKKALNRSKDLFAAKQYLRDFPAYLLELKKDALNNNYIKKPYPSCVNFTLDDIKMQIKISAGFLLPETTLKLEQALKNFADLLLKAEQKQQQNQPLSEQERLQFERAKATLEQLMTPLLQGQLPLEQRLFKLKQQVNKLLELAATLDSEEGERKQAATLDGEEKEEEQTATLDGEEKENVKTLIEKLGKLKLELIRFMSGDSLTANPELEIIKLEEQITLLTNELQSFEKENVQQLTPAVEQAQQQVTEINQYLQTLNRKVEVLAKLADGSYSLDQITEAVDQIAPVEEQQQTALRL